MYDKTKQKTLLTYIHKFVFCTLTESPTDKIFIEYIYTHWSDRSSQKKQAFIVNITAGK